MIWRTKEPLLLFFMQVRTLCIDLNAAGVKRVKMAAEALHSAKMKQEKEAAAKAKKGKGKGGSLRMDTNKARRKATFYVQRISF